MKQHCVEYLFDSDTDYKQVKPFQLILDLIRDIDPDSIRSLHAKRRFAHNLFQFSDNNVKDTIDYEFDLLLLYLHPYGYENLLFVLDFLQPISYNYLAYRLRELIAEILDIELTDHLKTVFYDSDDHYDFHSFVWLVLHQIETIPYESIYAKAYQNHDINELFDIIQRQPYQPEFTGLYINNALYNAIKYNSPAVFNELILTIVRDVGYTSYSDLYIYAIQTGSVKIQTILKEFVADHFEYSECFDRILQLDLTTFKQVLQEFPLQLDDFLDSFMTYSYIEDPYFCAILQQDCINLQNLRIDELELLLPYAPKNAVELLFQYSDKLLHKKPFKNNQGIKRYDMYTYMHLLFNDNLSPEEVFTIILSKVDKEQIRTQIGILNVAMATKSTELVQYIIHHDFIDPKAYKEDGGFLVKVAVQQDMIVPFQYLVGTVFHPNEPVELKIPPVNYACKTNNPAFLQYIFTLEGVNLDQYAATGTPVKVCFRHNNLTGLKLLHEHGVPIFKNSRDEVSIYKRISEKTSPEMKEYLRQIVPQDHLQFLRKLELQKPKEILWIIVLSLITIVMGYFFVSNVINLISQLKS